VAVKPGPPLSYQVIARKWRPQSFDEVSGQTHVTTALRNAIRTDRIPHAMLLTGPRGVGKTTLARLIARCLNCEKGPTDQPCGSCPPCSDITEGRSTDVQEIDAASRTGVDDMREVIESIRYAAAPGKYRIFIIDEVHMLSGAAFNALLKTLEEPPPRSLFVFATTNPEKIPFTVLSRCQRHDLRRIALSSVGERLAEICAAEEIAITPTAIASIAREGDGSMRDAQTLLDQIIAYAGGQAGSGDEITDSVVADVLDLVDRNVLRAIVEACIDSDPKTALVQVNLATSGGSEARRIADALLELLRDLTVLRVAPDGEALFDGTDEERAELIELAGRTEPARLRRMFRALVREIEDLSWAPQPTAVLEMAVIRLATMPSGDDVSQLLSRLDQLERRLASGGGAGGGNVGGGRVSDRSPKRRSPESSGARAPSSPPASSQSAESEIDPFDRPPGGPNPSTRQATGQPKAAPAAPAARQQSSMGASRPAAAPNGSANRRTQAATTRRGTAPDANPAPSDPDAAFDRMPTEPARFDESESASSPPARPGAPANGRGAPSKAGRTPSSGEGVPPIDGGAPLIDGGAPLIDGGAPLIGGGAPPAAIFDRFRATALAKDRSHFASLDGTTLVGIEGNTIRIGAPAAFHVERLRQRSDDLEQHASALFGRPTKISIEIASGGGARTETKGSREQSRKRRQEALNSESVNLAIEVLNAEIVEIRPLGEKR
jgi:DNA polymerase-3 subunit gamma/tau